MGKASTGDRADGCGGRGIGPTTLIEGDSRSTGVAPTRRGDDDIGDLSRGGIHKSHRGGTGSTTTGDLDKGASDVAGAGP